MKEIRSGLCNSPRPPLLPFKGCCGGFSSRKLSSLCAQRRVATNLHIHEAREAINALGRRPRGAF